MHMFFSFIRAKIMFSIIPTMRVPGWLCDPCERKWIDMEK
jgi:hypothetical protein